MLFHFKSTLMKDINVCVFGLFNNTGDLVPLKQTINDSGEIILDIKYPVPTDEMLCLVDYAEIDLSEEYHGNKFINLNIEPEHIYPSIKDKLGAKTIKEYLTKLITSGEYIVHLYCNTIHTSGEHCENNICGEIISYLWEIDEQEEYFHVYYLCEDNTWVKDF